MGRRADVKSIFGRTWYRYLAVVFKIFYIYKFEKVFWRMTYGYAPLTKNGEYWKTGICPDSEINRNRKMEDRSSQIREK